jgi:hypothetical protein
MNVLLGLGIVSSILAYYGLSFLDSDEFWTNLLGQLFFVVSMLFLLLTVNTTFLIIKNSGLSYLDDSVGTIMLEVFYYFMVFGVVMYIFFMFIKIAGMMMDAIKGSYSRQKTKPRKDGDDQ